MNIGGYLKTSLIEWPEKISSVIFTAGCNFRCPFCHNAELVLQEGFTQIPEKQIFTDLKKRKEWNDVVIVTGGEPTIHKDLPIFLKKIKNMGYLIMLHTNGTNPKMIELLLKKKLIDRISIDVKGEMKDYQKYSNIQFPILNVKKSLELVINSGLYYELRTTVVPGLHNLENLILLAEDIKSFGQTDKIEWILQEFRPLNTFDKEYIKIKPFSKEEMLEFQKILQKIIPQTSLRGV
jgi:pyruvate formate lyase activating enzyme